MNLQYINTQLQGGLFSREKMTSSRDTNHPYSIL